tara:strand:+ start:1564 stop:2865 length:1302 start_codon:yes stop_codon:yes gene_type:complete
MELSIEQQNAYDSFIEGKNIFVTGPGGSGKSELIRHIVKYGEIQNKNIQVCALTGCATVLLQCKGAKTIHSWSGIGIGNGSQYDIINRISNNKHKKIAWKNIDILIVDEVSMMSKHLFDLLDIIGKKVRRNNNLPFGGIQLVFSGDFYQLPPVSRNSEQKEMSDFCFESNNWNKTFESIIQLKKIFRQTDNIYAEILNQIRIGKLKKRGYALIQNRVGKICENSIIKPTILLPKKKEVDKINSYELKKLNTEEIIYGVSLVKDIQKKCIINCSNEQEEYEYKQLQTTISGETTITLKIGTQVMCTANIETDGETPLVNGTQGIIVAFCNKLPVIKLKNGSELVIQYYTRYSENIPHVGIKIIPLIHAWAITIHKSQGVTLELAEIDAGNDIFECGQTYVALSRVKDLNGLFLKSFDYKKIKINKKVKNFYENL